MYQKINPHEFMTTRYPNKTNFSDFAIRNKLDQLDTINALKRVYSFLLDNDERFYFFLLFQKFVCFTFLFTPNIFFLKGEPENEHFFTEREGRRSNKSREKDSKFLFLFYQFLFPVSQNWVLRDVLFYTSNDDSLACMSNGHDLFICMICVKT